MGGLRRVPQKILSSRAESRDLASPRAPINMAPIPVRVQVFPFRISDHPRETYGCGLAFGSGGVVGFLSFC